MYIYMLYIYVYIYVYILCREVTVVGAQVRKTLLRGAVGDIVALCPPSCPTGPIIHRYTPHRRAYHLLPLTDPARSRAGEVAGPAADAACPSLLSRGERRAIGASAAVPSF
jgi:hypothetical protein